MPEFRYVRSRYNTIVESVHESLHDALIEVWGDHCFELAYGLDLYQDGVLLYTNVASEHDAPALSSEQLIDVASDYAETQGWDW